MKKFSLFLLLVVLSFNVFTQNEKAITSTNLNLREGQSAHSKSIKVIDEGDTVEIISKNLNWSKVKSGEMEGYVSTMYITQINSESENKSELDETSTNVNVSSILLYAIILLILGYTIYWMFTRKCANCGKFGSLRKNGSELIDSRPTKVKEVLKRYNNKGEVTSKREVLVDATIKKYRDFYICTKCNKTTTKLTSVTVKN